MEIKRFIARYLQHMIYSSFNKIIFNVHTIIDYRWFLRLKSIPFHLHNQISSSATANIFLFPGFLFKMFNIWHRLSLSLREQNKAQFQIFFQVLISFFFIFKTVDICTFLTLIIFHFSSTLYTWAGVSK